MIRVSLTNYVASAASISAVSEAANYAATNVAVATRPFIPYKSGAAGAGQAITIDLGVAEEVRVIALGRLNFTSLTVQADDAPTFNSNGGSPQFSVALTAEEAMNGRIHISHQPASPVTRRYWKIVISNQTTVAIDYPHVAGVSYYLIGWVWLGSLVAVPRDIKAEPEIDRHEPVEDQVLPSGVRVRSVMGRPVLTFAARRQADMGAGGLDLELRQWLSIDRAWSEVDAALVLPTDTVDADAYVMRRLTGPKFKLSAWSEGDLPLEEIVG